MLHHVWFGTKRRGWALQGDVELLVKQELRAVAVDKGIGLLECETMVDHVHLLVDVVPSFLPEAVRLLKGGSSYRVFRALPELKLDLGEQSLWQRRYGVRRVPRDQAGVVVNYIRTQDQRLEKYEW